MTKLFIYYLSYVFTFIYFIYLHAENNSWMASIVEF